MKKGENYNHANVRKFAEEESFTINERGSFNIGENFLVLKHETKDLTVTLLLTGVTNECIFECVYSDL